ncbi:toxin-antitoxin system, antitoxin component [Actinomyces ruminicola]|uniref:toxin-antitoxin system, antitoxin component n=1 Tax=Actinomyces ruminicola TaxID=332524 RepID=UPI0011C9E865|nr:toxin-antitoxin system, antitoxin component [Actinomyces ruminicola]
MCTTVDPPDAAHRRVKLKAAELGLSMSAMVVELTAAGLDQLEPVSTPEVDEETGPHLPRIGRLFKAEEVAALPAEDH